MSLHPETVAADRAQHDHVVKHSCGGTYRYEGIEYDGYRARCDGCRQERVSIRWDPCTTCDAMYVTYDGPDAPLECPGCRT